MSKNITITISGKAGSGINSISALIGKLLSEKGFKNIILKNPDAFDSEINVESIYEQKIELKTSQLPNSRKKATKKTKAIPEFMKPLFPSPELAEIIGSKPRPRTDIVSAIWQYIKKNELQDKKNRRMINADALIQPLFGKKKQVSMFDLVKIVSKHLSDVK